MCIFSGSVREVSRTKIFARGGAGGREFLIYAMAVAADVDLAMILPLPVPPGPSEDCVRFVDLKEYPDFFAWLENGFRESPEGLLDMFLAAGNSLSDRPLAVHDVGDYDASFVPSISDFDRLDPRFRIPEETWRKLPGYHDWGFAVFKLKFPGNDPLRSFPEDEWPPLGGDDPLRFFPEDERPALGQVLWFSDRLLRERPAGAGLVSRKRTLFHPMAFEFPRREPKTLFFPTVHIHDGEVHARASFDHILYCQPDDELRRQLDEPMHSWSRSPDEARRFVDVTRSQGIVAPHQHVYRKALMGELPNEDVMLAPLVASDVKPLG